MILYGVFGAGGFGREVMPIAAASLSKVHGPQGYRLAFVEIDPGCRSINGWPVMSEPEFLASPLEKRFTVAIRDAQVRRRIASKLESIGVSAFDVFGASALRLDNSTIGMGHIVFPFAVITSNVTIGVHFHAYFYSYVAHDCVVGDFVTFAPNVHCNGWVVIEDDVYVGAGAILKNGSKSSPLVIGRGATVGMGAVVTRSVPPGVTVVGNPARPLEKKGVK